MPEAPPWSRPRRTRELAAYVAKTPEVVDYQVYAGTAAPFNFNGLVRHYYQRQGPNVADIQVNLLPKHERKAQSHAIASRVRPGLQEIAARYGASVKVAEVPPGPPVLSTLVAEIYGPDYERQRGIARQVKECSGTEGVVDVDGAWRRAAECRFVVDRRSGAARHSTEQVAQTLRWPWPACRWAGAPARRAGGRRSPTPAPQDNRSSMEHLGGMRLQSPTGALVPLSELVKREETVGERNIYHKNLMPVTYVIGDVAGREESPVYPILKMRQAVDRLQIPEGYQIAQHTARQPFSRRNAR